MPSRNELRAELTRLTHESFSSAVPLNKTSYKQLEFNQILMQGLISFHGLYSLDHCFKYLQASPTNINTEQFRDCMRRAWRDHKGTAQEFLIYSNVNKELKGITSIGRNQAIQMIISVTTGVMH